MSMKTIYVPKDSASRSVGSDEVATAIRESAEKAGIPVNIVRNGSRGMLWLEPLVEVVTEKGRFGYGPVALEDVDDLVAAGLFEGGDHRLSLGHVDEIPWLAGQTRYTFGLVGAIDPLSAEDYEAHGGLSGLHKAVEMKPEEIVEVIKQSGLRGRGGAGFPTGVKWSTVLETPADDIKYVCANADEGDSGTFVDRMLMEGNPFAVIEGMIIAGIATGATEGLIYVRSEYPDAIATMRTAIEVSYSRGWLGSSVLSTDHKFNLSIRVGAGSYICGEETAMLESLEGHRGIVRSKPPLPAHAGLFGKPTVINNILTLASVPRIIQDGPEIYQSLGVGRSRGTQVFQIGGNVARGGIVELPFGVTLHTLVNEYGGGTRSGLPIRAVQVGGPLGAYLPTTAFDVPLDYESFAEIDAMVGHGGIVVFDESVDMARQARFAMEFCAEESCGKCTPCRVGAVRGVEVIDRIIADDQRIANLKLLDELCDLMTSGSLCAMGSLTPMPVRSALTHFEVDFHRSPESGIAGTGEVLSL